MPRILVADDNSNIQKMVALAFEEHGIDVVAVGNGEAAVRRLPDLNPDVVLADVFMPVRNGYEVCDYVKKDPRFSKIPVILLVGAFDPLDEQEARRVGADGVLKKPFVPPDPLIAMVTAALEKAAKPEGTAAAEPVAAVQIPAVAAAPVAAVPAPIPSFPDPTPEEEAYMFGSGRRSLDDDEKTEAAAPVGSGAASAPAAVQTAVETDADAEAEEDAKFSGTRADWRRREEVDFASVPSFSAELVDAPADARGVEASVAQNVARLVDQLARAPVAKADPFAAAPETEAKVESVFATRAVETVAEAPVAETVVEAPPVIEESRTVMATEISSAGYSPVMEEPVAEAPGIETRDVESRESHVREAEAKVEVVPTPYVEPVPVEAAAPFAESAPPARVEVARPAAEPEPTLVAAVVETVTSPRKWLDFLLPSRAVRSSPEPTSAEVVARLEAHSPHPPVEDASASAAPVSDAPVSDPPVAEPAAPHVATQDVLPEPAAAVTYEAAPVAPVSEHVPAVEEAAPVSAIEDSRQQWSEIASQLAAEAPLVEAAQTAMNAEPAAPVHAEEPPVFAREAGSSELHAAEGHAPEVEIHAHAESAAHEVPAPSLESLSAAFSAVSAQQAAPVASPNIDEVVAKILEKLGPQIQEMLAKGVVRPMVEDLLQKPDDKKK